MLLLAFLAIAVPLLRDPKSLEAKPPSDDVAAAMEVAPGLAPIAGKSKVERPGTPVAFHWRETSERSVRKAEGVYDHERLERDRYLVVPDSQHHDRINGRNYVPLSFPLPKSYTMLEDPANGAIVILHRGPGFKEALILRYGYSKVLYCQGASDAVAWQGSDTSFVDKLWDSLGRATYKIITLKCPPRMDSVSHDTTLPVRLFGALYGVRDFGNLREGFLPTGESAVIIDVDRPIEAANPTPVQRTTVPASLLERLESG